MATQLLDSVSDFQTVYQKLTTVDSFLQQEQFQQVLDDIKTCESKLKQMSDNDMTNRTLLSLLQRAFNRKFTKIRTLITQYLSRFLVIDSNSFSIYSQLRFIFTNSLIFRRFFSHFANISPSLKSDRLAQRPIHSPFLTAQTSL